MKTNLEFNKIEEFIGYVMAEGRDYEGEVINDHLDSALEIAEKIIESKDDPESFDISDYNTRFWDECESLLRNPLEYISRSVGITLNKETDINKIRSLIYRYIKDLNGLEKLVNQCEYYYEDFDYNSNFNIKKWRLIARSIDIWNNIDVNLNNEEK